MTSILTPVFRILALLFGLALVATAWGAEKTKNYADPGGAFAIACPEGWTFQREALEEDLWMTLASVPGQENASMAFFVFAYPDGKPPQDAALIKTALLTLVLDSLTEGEELQGRKDTKVAFAGVEADRCDFTLQLEEEGNVSFTFLSLLGKKNAVVLGLSCPAGNAALRAQFDAAFASFALESTQPTGAKSAASTLFTAERLSKLSKKITGNLKREANDKVLVAGKPALTYGAVAAFATLLQKAFGVELTETEFDLTAQQFSEAYTKGDAQTKTMLAQGWQQINQMLVECKPEELEANMNDVRQVLIQRFAAGAQAGIPWAQAVNDAIQRRTQSVATTKATRPAFAKNDKYDADMSEADLDAAIELIYFMWVASGRDTALVTPDAVMAVRLALAQGFPQFPAELQYVLANAQTVYAQVRGAWMNATPQQRAQLARGFGADLDALGLTVPRPAGNGGNGGGAWADWEAKVDNGTFMGEMVVGLAGNSYKNAWTTP